MHYGRWEPKSRASQHLVWTPPRVVPAKPSAPLSRHETHHNESSEFLWITSWTKGGRGWKLLPRGWTHYGMKGKSIWEHTGVTPGRLGQEPKAGKERGLGDLWRNQCGKQRVRGTIEGKRYKNSQLCVNSCLVNMLVWLCPAPDQCSFLQFLIKFLSLSWKRGCISVCVCMQV